jgi:hypothetical protein
LPTAEAEAFFVWFPAAIMKGSVVTNHMNAPVAPQATTQVIEVTDRQFGVPLGARFGHELARPPVQRPGQVMFRVVAGRFDLRLLATTHPHRADLILRIGYAPSSLPIGRRFVR